MASRRKSVSYVAGQTSCRPVGAQEHRAHTSFREPEASHLLVLAVREIGKALVPRHPQLL